MTPEQIEKVRAEFEADWMTAHPPVDLRSFDNYKMLRFPDGRYVGAHLEARWQGYLARAERDAAEIESLKAMTERYFETVKKQDAELKHRQARIAALESRLAAGEPVAWRFNWSHIEGHEEETSEWASMPFSDPLKNRFGANIEYAYLAQPPAAQVPDERAVDCHNQNDEEWSWNRGWNACRAAMLATHKEGK